MPGQIQTVSFDGREIRLTTGLYAPQAGGSVLIECGDTAVLVTATRAKGREGFDFLPLTCDYEEPLYAAGRIPGGFFKHKDGSDSQIGNLHLGIFDAANARPHPEPAGVGPRDLVVHGRKARIWILIGDDDSAERILGKAESLGAKTL